MQSAQIGIWEWDVQQDRLIWDDLMYQVYGIPRGAQEETVALWENALHPEDRERAVAALHAAARGEEEYNIEFRIVTPAGAIRHIKGNATVVFDGNGQPLTMLGTNRDITVKRVSEIALRELEKRNKALLDYSPVCHKIVDLDFRLRCMNANGFRMLSLPVNDDWYGRPYPFGFFPQSSKDQMVRELELVKSSGERRAFEAIAHNSHGDEVWLFHTLIPVPDDSGELDFITVVSADITEQKDIQEQLRHREKMDAIGQLAGGIAHDFNNQLASIMGYAEILDQRISDPALKPFVEKIIAAAERSGNLTRQMLTFSRKQALSLQPLDIHDVIAESLELLAHSVDKRITVNQQLRAPACQVNADKSQIHSALLNLAINARDAMPEGGTITITTECVELDNASEKDRGFMIQPGSYLQISVADTGCGIDEKYLPKIFEPFFTTKAPEFGTGMGLASVYGIVQHHGGFIDVESEVGKGSCFTLYLPLDSGASHGSSSPVTTPAAESSAEVSTPSGKILIVDDEAPIRMLCQEMLEAAGHQTCLAANGMEAVDLYRDHWQEIDAVILDMVMPEMNGKDAYFALKEINPAVKVIISTGYDADSSYGELQSQGLFGAIEKPFKLSELLDLASRAVAGSASHAASTKAS